MRSASIAASRSFRLSLAAVDLCSSNLAASVFALKAAALRSAVLPSTAAGWHAQPQAYRSCDTRASIAVSC
jgi:hypothetical protein